MPTEAVELVAVIRSYEMRGAINSYRPPRLLRPGSLASYEDGGVWP